MAMQTPVCEFGWPAVDFDLPGVDGRRYKLADIRGPKGALVMFICNHCPYVKGAIERIVDTCARLRHEGVGAAAIMSNDAAAYPDDSFDNMAAFAQAHRFGFPYLYDETQEVARAYDAACTPDFFGFNADMRLQYRGRLDDGGRVPPPPGGANELLDAMRRVAETGQGPAEQTPSMGCSIKWKAA